MKITNAEKLMMVKEQVLEGKTLSHVSERYRNYDIGRLKYLVNLYKKFGEEPFINRTIQTYRRDTNPRKNYLDEDEKYKATIDKKIKGRKRKT